MTSIKLNSAATVDEYGLNRTDLLRVLCIVADYRLWNIGITAREVDNMLSQVEEQWSRGGLSHLERRGWLKYVGKSEPPHAKMFVPSLRALQAFPALPSLAKCGELSAEQARGLISNG